MFLVYKKGVKNIRKLCICYSKVSSYRLEKIRVKYLYWFTNVIINSSSLFPDLFVSNNNHTNCNACITLNRFYAYYQSLYSHISVKVEGQLFVAQFYKWGKWDVEIFRKHFEASCFVNSKTKIGALIFMMSNLLFSLVFNMYRHWFYQIDY